MIIQLLQILVIFTFFNLLTSSKTLANYIKTDINPILTFGPEVSWESQWAYGTSVIFDEDKLKIWYSGNNGINKQIGFATYDGIFYIKSIINPLIKWSVVSNADIGIEHPTVLSNSQNPSNKYLMWFNNVSFDNFQLYQLSSINGVIWDNLNQITLFPTTTEWDSKYITAPSVIYKDQEKKYLMWYTARGLKNNRFAWRIGFATSDDGINWIKHPEPVLVADQIWEGSDVGNPSVLLEDGVYHMWYHADKAIGHAVSFDGINWEKDPGNPVLEPGPTTWDLFRVMNPSVLKKDNTYYMFYTGAAFDGRWQIGLATTNEIFQPSITPTPPTSTPTPTATPTPTVQSSLSPTPSVSPAPTLTITLSPIASLTPSPAANPDEPIVFIPGLGASWNPFAIFSCQLPINSLGSWKLASYAFVYQRFIKTLTKNANLPLNKQFFIYAYDWRQPLDIQAEQFNLYINQILQKFPAGTKVKIVGHSLGGLVVRSYISKYPDTHRASTVITVGTPHEGTVVAYPVWENGEIWENNLLIQLALTQILTHCRIKRTLDTARNRIFPLKVLDNKKVIQDLVPSIESLLPTFDFLRINGNLIFTDTLYYQNQWMKHHPFLSDLFHTTFVTLSGNDRETLRFLDVEELSGSEKQLGNWLDGKPINKLFIPQGDGTVLHISSSIPNAINEQIDGDHVDIITSTAGITKILQYLNLSPVKPAEFEYKNEATSKTVLMLSMDYDSQFDITDPYRKVTSAQSSIISLFNPIYGIYKIRIRNFGSANRLYISLAQENKTSVDLTADIVPFQNKSYQLIYSRISSAALQLIALP